MSPKGKASDQSQAPHSASAAQQSRVDQPDIDPLQRLPSDAEPIQASQANVDVAPGRGVNETKQGHTTLSVRTVPQVHQSHPLASRFSGLQESPSATNSPARASPSNQASSPLRSRDSQESFAGQVLAHARSIGAKVHHDAVSFAAIAKNPSLARLARAELDEHQHNTAIEKVDTDGPVASTAFYAHDAEVERQWAALEAVNADTKEESTLNKELSFLICARLEASRRSSERLLGVLQVAQPCTPSPRYNELSKESYLDKYRCRRSSPVLHSLSNLFRNKACITLPVLCALTHMPACPHFQLQVLTTNNALNRGCSNHCSWCDCPPSGPHLHPLFPY